MFTQGFAAQGSPMTMQGWGYYKDPAVLLSGSTPSSFGSV